MPTVIQVTNLSKQYRLGQVGTGTISHDLNRWWHHIRGKEDPFLKIGEENDRSKKGSSDYAWALRDINFEVQQGEVLGIIGRNGAGKSTLLKILSRTTAPTTGNIKIKGRVASLLEVGTGFHPEMTGRENIFLNGAILGMTSSEIKSKFEEIVDFAGVERYIDTPVKRYSSGMYVRLAFAVAAHLEPEILIVDEVLSVGDAEFQKKCLGKMKNVSVNEGRTVLFVSHHMNAIENLCTRTLLIDKGQLKFAGAVDYVINEYSKAYYRYSDISISERRDRQGNGKIKMTKFYIQKNDNIVLEKLKSGNNFQFVIEYENKNFPEIFKSVEASIALHDNKNQAIFLVRSNFTNENLVINQAKGRIICEVKDFAIANGDYSVMAYLGYAETEIYDLVENVMELTVEGGDFFKTGSIGLPSFCKILTRSKWIHDDKHC